MEIFFFVVENLQITPMWFNFARGCSKKNVFFQIFSRVLFEKMNIFFAFFKQKHFFGSCFIAEKIAFFPLFFFFDKKIEKSSKKWLKKNEKKMFFTCKKKTKCSFPRIKHDQMEIFFYPPSQTENKYPKKGTIFFVFGNFHCRV